MHFMCLFHFGLCPRPFSNNKGDLKKLFMVKLNFGFLVIEEQETMLNLHRDFI